jgi:hypothetical protein
MKQRKQNIQAPKKTVALTGDGRPTQKQSNCKRREQDKILNKEIKGE